MIAAWNHPIHQFRGCIAATKAAANIKKRNSHALAHQAQRCRAGPPPRPLCGARRLQLALKVAFSMTATAAGAPRAPASFERLATFDEAADLTRGKGARDSVLGAHGLTAWRHGASGVRVVRFAAPGPIVSLSMFVGTEPAGDGGHPHTLEHIVFLGSKRHPERGYLDTLACRCLGAGTNAYTANEYTCYTAATAGVEGFLHLLPAYLDHLLRPNRTADEAAFASEVYHCRPDGKEAGVVMSEMAAREHTEPDMMDRELRHALLAGTPLAMEAGGLCDSIRLLSPSDIHSYHQRMYCGANVSVVIGASAEVPDNLFLQVLAPLLDEYSSAPGFDRGAPAWPKELVLQPLPTLEKRFVEFPCADASMGSVSIAWRLPSTREVYQILALEVLLEWLCDFDASPLPQKFVMVEAPLASCVDHEMETYLDVSTVCLMLEGVEHLEEDEDDGSDADGSDADGSSADMSDGGGADVDGTGAGSGDESEDGRESLLTSGTVGAMVVDFLQSIVTSKSLPCGLKSLHAALERHAEEQLMQIESDAHDFVPNAILDELIYGDRMACVIGSGIRNELSLLDRLRSEPAEFWLQLLETYFVSAPRVEIYMVPAPSLAERLAADANVQQEERKANHAAPSNVDELLATLDAAVFADEALPAQPNSERVPRIPYSVSTTTQGAYFGQQVAVDSGLVHATIVFSTSCLSFSQRMCLPLLAELLLSMDLELDEGVRMPYMESSRAISEATVGTDSSGSWLGKLTSMGCDGIGVNYAATAAKFELATSLILRAVFHGHVSGPRISSEAKNYDSDNVECMRDAATVRAAAAAVLPRLSSGVVTAATVSNAELGSLLGRSPLLEFIAEEYSRSKGRSRVRRKIVQLFESTLKSLREQPGRGIFVQIGARNPGNAMEVFDSQWVQMWRPESVIEPNCRSPMLRAKGDTLESLIGVDEDVCRALAVPGSETSYFTLSVDCDVSQVHPEWPSLQVLLELISRDEGVLFNAVRGEGFAYGVALSLNQWHRRLSLSVSEASLPVYAWVASCKALEKFREGLAVGNDDSNLQAELATAKSALLFGTLDSRATPSMIISGSLAGHVLGLEMGPIADRTNEDWIERVDIHSLRTTFDKHVLPLLSRGGRLATLSGGPSTLPSVTKAFHECYRPLNFDVIDVDSCDLAPVVDVISQLEK